MAALALNLKKRMLRLTLKNTPKINAICVPHTANGVLTKSIA
jgi:hypothetical protein